MNLLTKSNVKTTLAVILSALCMAFVSVTFTRPADLLPGGFFGIATLIEMTGELIGFVIPTSVGLILLNIPVAILCYKKISPRFVFFSLAHVFLTSFFLQILPTMDVMEEPMLNVIFGGFLFGASIVLVLKANASSGGSDFIALYVSNKSNREIWQEIFMFNAFILCIFGYMFGFENAGYSILFQFISMKTVSTFHVRYKRVMMQIFTKKKDIVVETYCQTFRHGITVMDGIGGYSKKPVSMLTAIVSTYEVDDVIQALLKVDEDIIVNVSKSEKYIGRFYMMPIE